MPTAGLKTPLIPLPLRISDLLLLNDFRCFSDSPSQRFPQGTNLSFDVAAFSGDMQGMTVVLGCCPGAVQMVSDIFLAESSPHGTKHFLSQHPSPSTASFLQSAAVCGMGQEPLRLSEPNHTRRFISTVSFQLLTRPTFHRLGILSGFRSCLLALSSLRPPPISLLRADFESSFQRDYFA